MVEETIILPTSTVPERDDIVCSTGKLVEVRIKSLAITLSVCDSKRNQIDGLIWIDRVPLSVRSWIDDETGNNVWGGRARYGASPVNWVSWYGCIPS